MYSVFHFIVHEGGDGTVLRGVAPCLSRNMNGGLSNPKLIDQARNDTRKGSMAIKRHSRKGDEEVNQRG